MKKNIPFLVILLCSAFIMDIQAGNGKKSYAARRKPKVTSFQEILAKSAQTEAADLSKKSRKKKSSTQKEEISIQVVEVEEVPFPEVRKTALLKKSPLAKEESIKKASKELADKAITAALVVRGTPEVTPHTPIIYSEEEQQVGENLATLFDLSPEEAFQRSQVLKLNRQRLETERTIINNKKGNIAQNIYNKEKYELSPLPHTTLKDLQEAEKEYQLALLTYRDMQKVVNVNPSHLAEAKKTFIEAQQKRDTKQSEFTVYNSKELEIDRLTHEKRALRKEENALTEKLNGVRKERKEFKTKYDLYTLWSGVKSSLFWTDEDAIISDLEPDTDDEETKLPVFGPVNQITQSK